MSQPMPGQGRDLVSPEAISRFCDMFTERVKKGLETYGTKLMTFNGRDALADAMEEVIDAWQYIVQAAMERDVLQSRLCGMCEWRCRDGEGCWCPTRCDGGSQWRYDKESTP